jgi:hypothetical protein
MSGLLPATVVLPHWPGKADFWVPAVSSAFPTHRLLGVGHDEAIVLSGSAWEHAHCLGPAGSSVLIESGEVQPLPALVVAEPDDG